MTTGLTSSTTASVERPHCIDGWLGDDEQGRPRPCLICKPHLQRRTDVARHDVVPDEALLPLARTLIADLSAVLSTILQAHADGGAAIEIHRDNDSQEA